MITQITGAFTEVLTWLVSAMNDTTSLFWDASAGSGEGSFTLLGYLVIIPLAIGVVLLLVRMVSDFFHFRG